MCYSEEKIIDGKLMRRNYQDGEWKPLTEEKLNEYIVKTLSELKLAREELNTGLQKQNTQDIKVEITPIEMYEVKVNGVNIGNFEKVDSWESIVKMKNDNRNIIDKIFCNLESSDFTIVKITPSLLITD